MNISMSGYKGEVIENFFLMIIRYKKKTFEITQRVTKSGCRGYNDNTINNNKTNDNNNSNNNKNDRRLELQLHC